VGARWRATTVVLALALGGVGAADAHANPGQQSIFMDDNLLLYRGDEVSDRTLDELKDLGVDRVRISVHWRAIAPGLHAAVKPASLGNGTDPSRYPRRNFDIYDHVLRAAERRGITVLANVTGGAPLWATGVLDGRHVGLQYKPSPREFGRFVEMLGKRYDGTRRDENQGRRTLPRVNTWSIWNEPNQAALLQPQWERSPRTGDFVPAAPRVYRGLVRFMTSALLRTGHGDDTVLLGETAPRGVDRRGMKGSLRPIAFLDALLCLDPLLAQPTAGTPEQGCDFASRGPLQVTGYAHHPYSVVAAPETPDANPLDVTLADRDRLEAVLDVAAQGRRVPHDLPFWWTEFGWQTLPPDPVRGVSLQHQADWIARAEHMTWADRRVVAHTQFLLRDDDPRREPGASLKRRWGTYQTGLTFAGSARRKPSYEAYRLPFTAPAQIAAGQTARLWGFVRPGDNAVSQHVAIEFKAAGGDRFERVKDVIVTDARGYFETDVRPTATGRWRFAWEPPAASDAEADTSPPTLRSRVLTVRVG
jgi:hypothetical protein